MAGHSCLSTPCPSGSFWMVEDPSSLSTLHHWDFLPQVHSPGSRHFCITRQEEILTLAWALQCCAERLGCLLESCVRLHRTSKGAWPLMQLDSDKIMEASLLGPTNNRPIMPPTSEIEAVLLGGWSGAPRGPAGYHIFPWTSQNPLTRETKWVVWCSKSNCPFRETKWAVWCSKSTCPFNHSLQLPG